MSEPEKIPNPFELVLDEIRALSKKIDAALNSGSQTKPLTAAELAKVLNVNKAKVYELVKAKKIPYLGVGRKLRFNLQAVLDALKKSS